MLQLIKGRYKIAKFCGYTVVNETLQVNEADTINDCRIYFNFLMPSEMLEIRRNKCEGKFIDCCNLLYYFGINKIT